MRRKHELTATIVATLVVLFAAAVVLALGAGSAGAVHPGDAQDLTEHANFTINFPYATDHYPGDQNTENGSIEYFATGEDSFREIGAEDGFYYDWIIVHAEYEGEDWIDYSACDTQNTKAFGIDRGNNNSGTQPDDDLITKRKDSEFRDDGIVIEFYDWEDTFEDPPYMRPEDAMVAAQGAGSPAGPCLTLTETPGWYRIAAFANGTVNDNDPDEPPTDDAAYVRFQLESTYVYVCECDSEEEARDELGPPPNEGGQSGPQDDGGEDDGSADDGSADDGSADDGSSEDGSADDGAGDDGGDGSADDGGGDGGAGDDGGDDGAGDDGGDDGADDDGGDDAEDGQAAVDAEDGEGTPAADGPGFGAIAALVALLAAALLVVRRR